MVLLAKRWHNNRNAKLLFCIFKSQRVNTNNFLDKYFIKVNLIFEYLCLKIRLNLRDDKTKKAANSLPF